MKIWLWQFKMLMQWTMPSRLGIACPSCHEMREGCTLGRLLGWIIMLSLISVIQSCLFIFPTVKLLMEYWLVSCIFFSLRDRVNKHNLLLQCAKASQWFYLWMGDCKFPSSHVDLCSWIFHAHSNESTFYILNAKDWMKTRWHEIFILYAD